MASRKRTASEPESPVAAKKTKLDAKALESLSVGQLRDKLREMGLPTTGNKAELVSRAAAAASENNTTENTNSNSSSSSSSSSPSSSRKRSSPDDSDATHLTLAQIRALKVPEIKKLLKDSSLPCSGKKEVLVQRLYDSYSSSPSSPSSPSLASSGSDLGTKRRRVAKSQQKESNGQDQNQDVLKAIDSIKAGDIFVSVEDTSIGDEGAEQIAFALGQSKTLEVLHLTDETIGDKGLKAIAAALVGNKTLHTLSVDCPLVTGNSAVALAAAIKTTSLKSLLFFGNTCGDEGAEAFASILSSCALEYLDLSWNKITDTGASAVAQALSKNPPLRKMSLIGNSISQSGLQELAATSAINTKLISLPAFGNESSEAADTLFSALRDPKRLLECSS